MDMNESSTRLKSTVGLALLGYINYIIQLSSDSVWTINILFLS